MLLLFSRDIKAQNKSHPRILCSQPWQSSRPSNENVASQPVRVSSQTSRRERERKTAEKQRSDDDEEAASWNRRKRSKSPTTTTTTTTKTKSEVEISLLFSVCASPSDEHMNCLNTHAVVSSSCPSSTAQQQHSEEDNAASGPVVVVAPGAAPDIGCYGSRNLSSSKIPNLVPPPSVKLDQNSSSAPKPCPLAAPLVVTIVGLPCRGKSLASHKVARNLNWRGESAKGKFPQLSLLFSYLGNL
ncbi:uncharacterized protein LOC129741953 [Uranotaenia lowii]|uniref:uncharacterized protein LOC129741953 n=1 Tax=Uranotaenia lowii TaxID=190385 RepID=UPI002479584C|nr:uncharacterized protein LOC129741953 [Uranotaenia lowii]